eukprot:GHVU01034613.1.p4 GENE.GHVU01034613.1~~GHVU01034613.1.p4  ORF type:complete len:141 (-),score=7.24 GHVU01034613.1:1322-1744(-)
MYPGDDILYIRCSLYRPETFDSPAYHSHPLVRLATTKKLTLQGLFDSYAHKEKLTDDWKYDCTVCGEKKDAEKWVEVTSPPPHMMVVLKRFSWDPNAEDPRTGIPGVAIKEPTLVEIDRSVIVGGVQYDLYAAIIHVVSR